MARTRQIRVDRSFEADLRKMKRDFEIKNRRKFSMGEVTKKLRVVKK